MDIADESFKTLAHYKLLKYLCKLELIFLINNKYSSLAYRVREI